MDELIAAVLASIHPSTSDWISLAGLAVAVFSLVVAFVGSRRAQRKAEAAQRQTAGVMLLSRTPDLEAIELQVRTAAATADRGAAETAVLEWRRVAPEYQALLRAAKVVDVQLNGHLELSLALIDIALRELAQDDLTPERACRQLLQHTGAACALGHKAALDMMMSVRA
jgi:hypothetical protein